MIQNWVKLGLIFQPRKYLPIGYDYAAVPVAMHLVNNIYRVFFSARDTMNKSTPFYFDFDIITKEIITVNNTPLFEPGVAGCFDEDGIMPCAILKDDDRINLYYIGWNKESAVPFRNALGIAISTDNGNTFHKPFEGPLLDRNITDPIFIASSEVLKEENVWRIYYLSCIKWERENNLFKHFYHLKYAESNDGLNWVRENKIAIDFKNKFEYAISTPRVFKNKSGYEMWYSYRASEKFSNYLIGYATSANGIDWIRKDELVNLIPTENSWDSEMICYPFIIQHGAQKFMLYNGNGYGKSGIGIAEIDQR